MGSHFHAELFAMKNQHFFKPHCLDTPNLPRSLMISIVYDIFCCIWVTAAGIWNAQYSAGIWVTRTEKGNPIIVSPCTWNEWICTVSSGLDSNAAITMTGRLSARTNTLQAFHPSKRRGRAMTSPRIFVSPGRCLFSIAAAAVFECRWSGKNIYHLLVLPEGIHYAPPDPICFADWETSKYHWLAKLQNLQESRKSVSCQPLLQLGVKLNASKHQFHLKIKKLCSQSHLFDLCYSSVTKDHLLAGLLLSYTIQAVSTEAIKKEMNTRVQNSRVTEMLDDLKPQHELTGKMPQPNNTVTRTWLWLFLCYTSVH